MDAHNGVEMAALPVDGVKNKPPRSLGRPEFDTSSLQAFIAKSPTEQREELKQSWASAAYILAERLKRFSMTVSRKDFGRLQQLATSAGVAFDKVFPKGEQQGVAVNGNVIFNLFGSLGGDKVMRIIQPPIPTIPKEITHGVSGTESGEAGKQDQRQDLEDN